MSVSKIDTRVVYTLVAPEQSQGVFPTNADWRKLDLNSYSDAGSTYESTPREVMDGSRQARKGRQSNKTVNFGYNIDVTKSNTAAQVASFLYGKPTEKYTTRSIVAGSLLTTLPTIALQGMTATTVTASASVNGLTTGDIVIIEDGMNDRTPLVVEGVADSTVTFAQLNATDTMGITTDLANARLVKVGVKAAAGDLTLVVTSRTVTVQSTTLNFNTLGIQKGEWVFVGGDATATRFARTEPFYARVSNVAENALTFDTTTSPVVADDGAGVTITLYLGTFTTNGDTVSTYTHARHLGLSADGETMVETFTGCTPNELSLNLSESSFVSLDMSYMATDHKPTALSTVDFQSTYAKVSEAPDDEAFHTSSDFYRQRLAVHGVNLNPAALTSFVQEASITISNNLSEDTGLGKLGAFDFSVGNFGLTGSITAYFVDLAAINAIRCNCTVGMDLILATKNTGIVVDVPSFTLGGNLEVEANTSIKIALEQTAFKSSEFGFMIGWTSFAYLPTIAMPEGQDDCEC